MTNLEPVTLEGAFVRLEPLSAAHFDALSRVAYEPSIWTWTLSHAGTPGALHAYIDQALAARAAGKQLPFATVERATGAVVGSTRFDDIESAHRRLEIGYTWLHPRWQRTAVNTEAKYLMLKYAFETLGCIRVQLKTDSLNEKSRNAILRLGARQEGMIRNHYILPNGRIRHSLLFSVLDTEWDGVKANLEVKLYSQKRSADR